MEKLTLSPDKPTWKADGMDLMHIRVEAVDKHGVVCPYDADRLTFSVEGDAEIVAVDNGDITSNEPFTGNSRSLYHGSALVILRSGNKGGKVKVTVSDGQRKATTTIATADKG